MEFFNATEAKQFARNKQRILKEINDIEESIADAVGNDKFECEVVNTIMTDPRENPEPIGVATSFATMSLTNVVIPYINESTDNYYFRVGERLVIKNDNNIDAALLEIIEIDDNGQIKDIAIVERGTYNTLPCLKGGVVTLEYEDMRNWLNPVDYETGNYGVISDLRIERDSPNYQVKDLDVDSTNWFDIKAVYTSTNPCDNNFGVADSLYIVNEFDDMYVKTDVWVHPHAFYKYDTFNVVLDYGFNVDTLEGHVIWDLYGKNYVHTGGTWKQSPHVRDNGNIRPTATDYGKYDICYWIEVIYDENGVVVNQINHRQYKNFNNVWLEIVGEENWENKPSNNFGVNTDVMLWKIEDNNYQWFVKSNNEWKEIVNVYRFDEIHEEGLFGQLHDLIKYVSEDAQPSWYVKVKTEMDLEKWVKVEKIWDFNEIILGRLSSLENIVSNWYIKDITMTNFGNGYIYQPIEVIIQQDDTFIDFQSAVAEAEVSLDKIIQTKVIYGGFGYTIVPTITYKIQNPNISLDYFKVWKQVEQNPELDDEMNQVMSYFNGNRQYTIVRVTNESSGNTFKWKCLWK